MTIGVFVQPSDGVATLGDHFRTLGRLTLECEDEAWRMSQRPLARGTTAFVSETLRNCGDLGEAMRRIARAYNIIHGGNFNRIELRSDRAVYYIDDGEFPFVPQLSNDAALTMMETVLIFVHAMLSLVAGRDLAPYLECVRVRRPSRPAEEGPLSFWLAPLRFGSLSYQLEYAPAVAAIPVRADFAGFSTVEIWAQAIGAVEAHSRPKSDDLTDLVRAAIVEGKDDQARVARRLGVSVATLRRRLEICGFNFRELRAKVLNTEACRLLGDGREVAAVAELLGFADQRSFSRAFKNWNGVTPSAYAGTRGGSH